MTHDLERATRFYEALFGWSAPEKGFGRVAVMADPEGAVFSVVEPS